MPNIFSIVVAVFFSLHKKGVSVHMHQTESTKWLWSLGATLAFWVLNMGLVPCHHFGFKNLEVARKFLENLFTRDVELHTHTHTHIYSWLETCERCRLVEFNCATVLPKLAVIVDCLTWELNYLFYVVISAIDLSCLEAVGHNLKVWHLITGKAFAWFKTGYLVDVIYIPAADICPTCKYWFVVPIRCPFNSIGLAEDVSRVHNMYNKRKDGRFLIQPGVCGLGSDDTQLGERYWKLRIDLKIKFVMLLRFE